MSGIVNYIAPSTATLPGAFILSPAEQNFFKSYLMASGNGTVGFGLVKAGTPMGLDSDGKARPAVNTTTSTTATGTTKALAEVGNIYVGDTLYFQTSGTSASVVSKSAESGAGNVVLDASIASAATEIVDLDPGNGSEAVGLLEKDFSTAHTINPADHTSVVHRDQTSRRLLLRGAVDESLCVNLTAALKADLTGITFVS